MASATPDQTVRPTFPAAEHHRPLAGAKLRIGLLLGNRGIPDYIIMHGVYKKSSN